jgi:hypothetical protein
MKNYLLLFIVLTWCNSALADNSNFSELLYPKFQTKGCTLCHDFFEKERSGLALTSHSGRSPEICAHCHTKQISGFKNADDWFAQPGLYTSGMDAQQTCEAIKSALHAKFKSNRLLARQMELHLFEDPRVLWGIEGATLNSGMLPGGEKEKDLVKGGLPLWKDQVRAWIQGGMKCQ